MNLNKFAKKLEKTTNDHFGLTGELITSFGRAENIMALLHERDEKGKDSSDMSDLVGAAKALIEATEAFDYALNDLYDNIVE